MNVLAIDTAADRLGVAIAADRRLLAEATYTMGRRHGELITVVMDEMLGRVGLRPADLDGIAVSLGPGSFTGVRIGLAAAKTLAYASGLPLVGIGSLELLAASAAQGPAADGTVLTLLDARRDDAYAAAYTVHAGQIVKEQLAPTVAPLTDWLEQAAALPGPYIVTGDGAESLWPAVQAQLPEAKRAGPLHRYARSAVLALLGEQRLAAGERADAATLVPEYLRRPAVAEQG